MLFIASAVAAGQVAAKFTFMDEGTGDAGLMATRRAAIAAVKVKDVAALRVLLSSDAAWSFRLPGGPDRLIAGLGLNSRDSTTWDDLAIVLAGGGGYAGGPDLFIMPFVETGPVRVQPGWCVGVERRIPVRAKPDNDAAEVWSLGYDLVRVEGDSSNDEWTAVEVEKGKLGFVRKGLCRGAGDLRVYFGKGDARWRITAIIGGD